MRMQYAHVALKSDQELRPLSVIERHVVVSCLLPWGVEVNNKSKG